MTALILNSGLGHRMGELTKDHPKCMTELSRSETILSRQLKLLAAAEIHDVVITTGYYDSVLEEYCRSLALDLNITFVCNPLYASTNYIYSIYCAREHLRDDDIVLMHGDLVFEEDVLRRLLAFPFSCMTVSSTLPLPQKDFKAVVQNDRIERIGIHYFDNAVAAQPLYKFRKKDWLLWLQEIERFCESGDPARRSCYAENAFNEISDRCPLYTLDVLDALCGEIDTPEDLQMIQARLAAIREKTVYLCFSTDMVHSGHVTIIQKAAKLGRLIVGVLTDKAVLTYKRFPLIPFEERKILFENLAGVSQVVEQTTLSYRENLEKLRPDYVVHGDDWKEGFQKPIREEVIRILSSYGGQLVEFPYSANRQLIEIEKRARAEVSMPDIRRKRLKRTLEIKGLVTAIEAHNGLTGLIAENTAVIHNGVSRQFDCMWVSSLCDSTAKGKPDIELVDMSSRFRTIDDILDVTTKPIIFDGDTGGLTEHFVYTVRTLERMGVSMVIIEDKTGLKKNSLFGAEVRQTQAPINEFCEKIRAGKAAQKTADFMICARIESLILEQGMQDALTRAFAFANAGADAIMIHSRKKDPSEVFEFVRAFRRKNETTYLVVVPTSFNSVTEDEFRALGVNVVIYANHLTRAALPAMQKAAELILENQRSLECDPICMPFKEIIRLIPEG